MLALTLCLAMPFAPQDPGPGISRALATARAAVLRDVEYDVRLRIEPGSPVVRGEAWVRFLLDDEVDTREAIVLDFGGSAIEAMRLNDQEFVGQPQNGHLVLPPAMLGRGWNGFAARFQSPVAATGTPLTVYKDPQDGREYYYTLVVPADAHRLFPCFDQPDLRARFRLELQLPSDWVAVANTPTVEGGPEATTEGRVWRFEQTRPLPTYLMAFACGPFAVTEAPLPAVPGLDPRAPLRIFHRRSETERLERDALVTMHGEGLRWLAAHFGVPYPFGKLDIALLPGFPYGGMEHAGAIFYRETALVFDHPPTDAELVRRSTLIYHEIAHQWFGNLVTMKWFDDLWLKEGFATFVAYQALDALEPGRKSWLRFLQRVKPRAYEVDATPGTTPIYQELGNLADAKSAYGPIVYNKAPAVLRALHERLGPAEFRAGLKRYLERHAFGSADWKDLAAALAGVDIARLGRWSERWLLAPSMPQVRVAWTTDASGTVQRATLQQRAIGGDGTWPLDLELLVVGADGSRRTLEVQSDAGEVPIEALVGQPAPLAVLANPRDVAYGQFVPDAQSRAWLLANLPAEPDLLLRAVASSAMFEAVREAELDPAAFADLCLRLLARETDPDTHGWLLDAFAACTQRYQPAARSAPQRTRAVELLLGQLQATRDSGRELTTLRFLLRTSTDERVLALARTAVRGGTPVPGLELGRQDRFLAAAALLAAGQLGDEYAELERSAAGQDVGKERFLARAAEPTAAAKQRYWDLYLQASEPPEQWIQDSLPFFHWPGQSALTLPFLRPALERVDWVKQNRRIFFMPAWLDGFVNGHGTADALAVVDAFLAEARLGDDVRKKLLQSRDSLARAVRIRATFGG